MSAARRFPAFVCSLLSVCAGVSVASAAPPKLTMLYPAGGQVGSEFVVAASGEFADWPVEVWSSRSDVQIKAEAEKGKLRVTIAKEAAPGVVWLRLFNAEGASSPRPLLIDQLPEIAENEPNNSPEQPQAVTLPGIVNGKLNKSGDVDGYAVTLAAGETLVASLRAHSLLGAPLDGVLQVCEVRERRLSSLANSPPQIEAFILKQNNDAFGLDPQIEFTAPRAGTYLVRVFSFAAEPNATIGYAGGDNYLYRLTLTNSGLVEYTLPKPGDAAQRLAFGPGLSAAGVATTSHFLANVAGFAPNSATDLIHEQDAAAALASKPTTLRIAGQLSAAEEIDTFRFHAVKDASIALSVRARSQGSPLDAILTVVDAEGKVLSDADDADRKPDPRLVFKAPADGEYTVAVRDVHRRGGLRYFYELVLDQQQTATELTLAADAFTVAAGGKLEIPVTLQRGAQAKEIAISATPLPAGVTVEPAVSQPQGESAKSVKLVLNVAADAPPGNYPITIGAEQLPANIPSPAALIDPPTIVWLTITAAK